MKRPILQIATILSISALVAAQSGNQPPAPPPAGATPMIAPQGWCRRIPRRSRMASHPPSSRARKNQPQLSRIRKRPRPRRPAPRRTSFSASSILGAPSTWPQKKRFSNQVRQREGAGPADLFPRGYRERDAPPVAVSRVGRDADGIRRFCECEARLSGSH